MSPERRGVVVLDLPSGPVELRFTWEAIDSLGRTSFADLFEKAQGGQAGDMGALADLVVIASAGKVDRAELMADPPSTSAAMSAVLDAWLLAMHGPSKASAEDQEPGDPAKPQPTWWSRLWAMLSRPA